MRIEIVLLTDIQNDETNGSKMGAVSGLISALEAIAKKLSIRMPDDLWLRIKVWSVTEVNERIIVKFQLVTGSSDSQNRESYIEHVSPAGYREPYFLADGDKTSPEAIFCNIFGRILKK